MVAHFARYGLAGLALFVMLAIFTRFDFNFDNVSSDFTAIIVLVICLGIILIVILTIILNYFANRDQNVGANQAILLKYEQVFSGLSSPEKNVLAIEEIVNSRHSERKNFLKSIRNNENISFIEQDAISSGLEIIDSKGKMHGTYKSLFRAESKRWEQPVDPNTIDGMTWMAVWGLKLWRYSNRRNHPQFKESEEALARVEIARILDEETLQLFNSLDIRR